MKRQNVFPAIHVQNGNWGNGQEVRATMGIRVASIQSIRLRSEEADGNVQPFLQHLQLLEALSVWPKNFSISMNLFTVPDVVQPLNGTVRMAVLLSCHAPTETEAKASLLGRGANLVALLNTYLNTVEFEEISCEDEVVLQQWFRPIIAQSAWSLDRFQDTLQVKLDQTHRAIGFLSRGTPLSQDESQAQISYLYPWQQHRGVDLSSVIEAMVLHPSAIWLRIDLRPAEADAEEVTSLQEALLSCERLGQMQTDNTLLALQLNALRQAIYERTSSLSRPVFRGSCVLYAEADLDKIMAAAVAGAISSPPSNTLQGGFSLRLLTADEWSAVDPPNSFSCFTPNEAACAFRIPMPLTADPAGLPIKSFRSALIPTQLMQPVAEHTILLGVNRHRGHISEVCLTDEERMRHMCVLGQTGSGKSVFLESLALQDIEQDKGLCFIDPHGDSIAKILEYFPRHRFDDLILVDFLDRDHVFPFNLLYCRDDEERDLIIDEMYAWLHMRYNMEIAGGPIFEQYFRGFLRLLMDNSETRNLWRPTMAEFLRMFTDERLRKLLKENITDSHVLRMIQMAETTGGDHALNNVVPYVTSKLNLFELDKGLRIITGQEEMRLNFDTIMDSGKVVLVNLGRGRFGESVASLLATQIICRIKMASLKRLSVPPEKRRDFFLYVDEFQNVASSHFTQLLSESRKFRLGLVLANQYAKQLDSDEKEAGGSVLDAVLGNVGALVCFRLGINDASTMSGQFYPEFNRHDLMNLPLGFCYMNLKSNRAKASSFSLETRYLPCDEKRQENAQDARNISNGKNTIPLQQAYDNIIRHGNAIRKYTESGGTRARIPV